MEFPPEVWTVILEYTDVSEDVKEFVSMRSVCRMFYDICTGIGAPIDYPHETLQALSPYFTQISNCMALRKPLTKDLTVPKKIKRLKFYNSGDANLTVSGDYLDTLEIQGYIEKSKPRSLPKVRFRKVKRLIFRSFELKEESFLPSMDVEQLYMGEVDLDQCKVILSPPFVQNLRSLSFDYFQSPALSGNNFSNLVVIANADLQNLTSEHLPNVILLRRCKITRNFFIKAVTMVSKDRDIERAYTCIESTRFYTGMDRDYVAIVNNFKQEHVHLLPPRESFSLRVAGVWPWDENKLISWIGHMEEKDSTISIEKGSRQVGASSNFGVQDARLETRIGRKFPQIKIRLI
ncbi:hypothetical protein BQ9231_00345 [Cedratvirus lausannensis]|uniref:Uncharacterized protein n=1 Tax=Cedratvirus lausannensis TaxID=2023205 RepID=A0A285PX32_9VIRU|nr:hypothetical protein BQ9231_00345 [Cedratvirus lausannensis]